MPPVMPPIEKNEPQPTENPPLRKPNWLKVKIPSGERYHWIQSQARNLRLHTVCEEARCPNIGECWQGGTATFMLMGDACTRGCRFCAVTTARNPEPLDTTEPVNIAETIRQMKLNYVVLTTVNRDDLPDQGAHHVAETIRRTQLANPQLLIEVLTPDFQGRFEHAKVVVDAKPAVFAHNLETVRRLTPKVRDPRATYTQSLQLLEQVKHDTPAIKTKSSLMVGLGESEEEVLEAMGDLRKVGVSFLTIGQYLKPAQRKLNVQEYLAPAYFKSLEQAGLKMGFAYTASGPLVRSSYRAAEFYIEQQLRR